MRGGACSTSSSCVYALIPVLWIISLSFKTTATLDRRQLHPARVDAATTTGRSSNTDEFVRALINSIGIALISTLIAVVLGTMAAYAIARLDFPGKKALVGVSLLIAMFPQIVAGHAAVRDRAPASGSSTPGRA